MAIRVVHCGIEPYDIYIGRETFHRVREPHSFWANPYRIGIDGTRDEVIDLYRVMVLSRPDMLARLSELEGKTLGCWCVPLRCHGHVLAELAEGLPPRP